MLSRAAFDRYDRQVRNIADGAADYTRRMVSAYLGQNPDASVAECREFAREVMAEAVRIYGDASATAAADYYDSVMEKASNGAKPALLHSEVDAEQVEKVARYQAGMLIKGDTQGFVKECGSYASDATRQAANRTMLENARRDGKRGVRYARITTGAENCAFCYMLASRGFVYKSDKSAVLFGHNHRGCNCEVVPSTDADGLEGYDPDGMRERMALMERQTGLSFADLSASRELSEFMALHDRDWLLTGKVPDIGYADEATKAKKLKDKDHPAELRVANRLRVHGFRTVYVDDEVPVLNEETGRLQIVGLPDLDTGLEIKNVLLAKSENTISKHISNAKRKRGYKQIVIDVSENPNISDEEARGMIVNSLRRHSMSSALMVNHEGEVEVIFYPQK